MQFIVFAIKQEISELYYYKADVMKRFFLEYIHNPESDTYNRQMNYITESFPYIDWLLPYIPLKGVKNNSSTISFPCSESQMKCDIIEHKNNSFLFQCDSLLEAEKVWIQPLRICSQSFYILEVNGEHYGWVSPITSQRLLS